MGRVTRLGWLRFLLVFWFLVGGGGVSTYVLEVFGYAEDCAGGL
jgi:hypothetical protein